MSAPLTFHLLGGAAIARGSGLLTDLRSRTAEALLIYLACHDRPLSRQFLADFFWDERTQKQAAANLRSILSMLRKQVGDYLIADRQTVAFNRNLPHWLDSAVFEQQIHTLEPHLNLFSPINNETYQKLETAIELYQGDFLEGFHLNESRGFEEWMIVVRERLRRLAALCLRRLVDYNLANGRYQEGIPYTDRLVAVDPYQEEAQRQRMWLLIRSGQRIAALQSYQTFKKLLEEDLGVDPSPATTAVYEKISAISFPPPDNLAVPPTPFIGREGEIHTLLTDILRRDSRLISIIGPGGTGKTRLATQVAHQLKNFRPGAFLDGVWFVPLMPVRSGRFLVTAIAATIGLTLRGTIPPRDQLLNYFQNREMLLILDNFEHLMPNDDSGLNLVELILVHAPQIKLLITTREQLNLREEQIFDLEGLPYPEDLTIPVESAVTYDAVDLFLQNAKRVTRHFTPDSRNIQRVVRLCRLLDGMPLGLEMAAAWVRSYDIDQILAQMEMNWDAIESTWRNVPHRHRSLQSVFDHSWQLLSEEEQAGFARLAVFQGGFTPAAALAVAGVSKPSLFQSKSLLRKDKDGRFEMHNLIHQFTARILHQHPEIYQETHLLHAKYYMALLKKQEPHFAGGTAEKALNLVSHEIENIRQAWHTALRQKELELLNQGYLSLYTFYEIRGWFEEGETLFGETVATLEAQLGGLERLDGRTALIFGRLQSRRGWFVYRAGHLERAREIFEICRTIFKQLNAEKDLAQSLNDLGLLSRRSGDYENARQFLLESLAIRRSIADHQGVAISLTNLANAVRFLGEYEQARSYLLESLSLLQEQGNLILLANVTNDIGETFRATENYQEARKYYEESLAIRQKIGVRPGIAMCLNNLGSVAHTLGDYESARRYAQESLAIDIEMGDKRSAPYPLSVLGRIARDEKDFPAAFSAFRRALQICQEINYVPKSLDILFELSTVLDAMNRPAKAVQLLAFVIHHSKINHETRKAAKSLFNQTAALLPPETAAELEQNGRNNTLEATIQTVLSRELEQID